jgi:phosphoribosylformimino-5-aminoimidazole carboxamide ribotide isomerase
MSEPVQIRAVPLEMVWQLRRVVLFPDHGEDRVKLADDHRGEHWGVYLADELISVISFFEAAGVGRFRKFATRVEWQGKGYGTQLLDHVMKTATASGSRVIWCNARTTALRFYERFGLRPVGDVWEENGYTYVKMEKQLE